MGAAHWAWAHALALLAMAPWAMATAHGHTATTVCVAHMGHITDGPVLYGQYGPYCMGRMAHTGPALPRDGLRRRRRRRIGF